MVRYGEESHDTTEKPGKVHFLHTNLASKSMQPVQVRIPRLMDIFTFGEKYIIFYYSRGIGFFEFLEHSLTNGVEIFLKLASLACFWCENAISPRLLSRDCTSRLL